jgi:orotidine-5'-phosphate decarboxylase
MWAAILAHDAPAPARRLIRMPGEYQMHGTPIPATIRRDIPPNMTDRLIVALDVRSPDDARALVKKLDGIVSFYKIGLWLFAEGTDKLIDELIKNGKNVFLDYKMLDIGETVREGVTRAMDRGVIFVTVHAENDETMKAAVAGKGGSNFIKIFAITVLTSMNDADLKESGYRLTVKELVELRVRKSLACVCDGIIASAADNPNEIRQLVNNQGLLIATPGIRPDGFLADDHKRLSGPTQAIRDGADYLVIGRPIIYGNDPASTARTVIEQMKLGAPNR